jgi:hypothetical protein
MGKDVRPVDIEYKSRRSRMRHKIKEIGTPHGLIGKRFGELTVLRRSRSGRAGAWIARCDCGRLVLVYDDLLKNGNTTNCGCDLVKQAT